MDHNEKSFLPTRESLLVRLKSWEDQEGWRDFFSAYWRLIYTAALKAGLNDSEAQDVVQDTVVAIARKMKDFRYDPAVDSFKGWLLYHTRMRIALEYRRRERERAGLERLPRNAEWLAEAEQGPELKSVELDEHWNREWEQNLWEAAIARVKKEISPKQFQMFSLYVLKEHSAEDVAKSLGVTAAQVYLAKHRITALLRKELDRLRREGI
jgi:RNA polymerase sigma factor (sigma-70 family)